MYSVLNTLSEYHTFKNQKTLLHTLFCLFLKLSNTFKTYGGMIATLQFSKKIIEVLHPEPLHHPVSVYQIQKAHNASQE